MIRLFLLAALVIVGGGADIPWDRIEGLTLEEAVVVLGPGHGFNVTRDGIVTLDDGERIDISSPAPFGFVGPVTAGIDPATRRRW
jgi:hypothetical protein